jgi:hypothetical protein
MDFDYDFTKQIVLVILPIIGGIATSKWITHSWQSRKEDIEIRRKILEQLDESYHRYYSLIANFINQVYRGYEDYTPRYDANGLALPQQRIFPTNTSDMPLNKFKNEFLEFQQEHDDISYPVNRFGSSMALYFHSLLKQMDEVDQTLELAFHMAIKLYHCQDKTSFEVCFDLAKDTLNKARNMQQKLAFQIIKSKRG